MFEKYMQFLNITNVEELLHQDTRQIESNIIKYIIQSRDAGDGYSYRRLRLTAILAFYSINDVVLNRKKLGKFLGEYVKRNKDRAYTIDEVHKMLQVADPRDKAIISLLACTGVRIGSVPELKLSHLQKISKYNLYRITIYENTPQEHFVFTTTEFCSILETYLFQRSRRGEKITFNEEKGTWSPANTPLFRRDYNKGDPFRASYPHPITKSNISYLLQQVLERAGIITITPRQEGRNLTLDRKQTPRSHGFRKMVNTIMIKAHVEPVVRKVLLNHSIGLDANYYRPSEEDLLNEYLKCVDLLTVNNEFRLQKQVNTLELENKELEGWREFGIRMDKRINELYERLGLLNG